MVVEMSLRLLDAAFAAVLFLLGTYILLEAAEYGFFRREVPGPGFFPFLTGLLLIICSGVNFFKSVGQQALLERIAPKELIRAGLLTGLIVLFAIASQFIGMAAAAIVFMFLSGLVLHEEKYDQYFLAKLAAISILAPSGCWFVFGQLLRVPLL